MPAPGLAALGVESKLSRNMSVYRTRRGELLLQNVIGLDDGGLRSLEALGTPAVMVFTHPFHIHDVGFFKARFPGLRVLAGAHARARLARKFGDAVPVDATPAEGLAELGVRTRVVPGMKLEEVVLDVDVPGGRALLFTDIFTALAPKGPLQRLFAAPDGGVGVARIVRMRQVSDRVALRRFFEELAALGDVQCLLSGHGAAVTQDCAAALRKTAANV
jgi:hypothetical protein